MKLISLVFIGLTSLAYGSLASAETFVFKNANKTVTQKPAAPRSSSTHKDAFSFDLTPEPVTRRVQQKARTPTANRRATTDRRNAVSVPSTQGNQHSHAGRVHSHPLPPSKGVQHKHGNGAVGQGAGNLANNRPSNPASANAQKRASQLKPRSNKAQQPPRGAVANRNDNNALQQAYKRKDYAAVYKIASPYAKKGDPAAQYVLGQLYLLGQGQRKNLPQAFNWFSKAAAKNHPGAQFLLGSLYA